MPAPQLTRSLKLYSEGRQAAKLKVAADKVHAKELPSSSCQGAASPHVTVSNDEWHSTSHERVAFV